MKHTGAVVTVSDRASKGERIDTSGDAAERSLLEAGVEVVDRRVVPDELTEIVAVLTELSDSGMSVIVTTGGTGLAPRDVTPEATRRVIEREAPGLSELIRAVGVKDTHFAALSRGITGTRKGTLIVNLPGSTAGVTSGMAVLTPLLPHALDTLKGHSEHN